MSYRNRCQVLGAKGVLNLSVPLSGGRDQKRMTSEVKIDYSGNWQLQHWRTLESCYNKSPFFFYYRDSLKELLSTNYKNLWELDLATLHWTLDRLKARVTIAVTEKFEKTPAAEITDLRNRFLPQGRQQRIFEIYQQVFDLPFETDLCILDLLFNLGPQSPAYLARQPFR